MNTAAQVFAHIPGWGVAGLAVQLNTVLLVAGAATLGGGLLVLLFTRWGQVRPLAKCVALSVFAHLLLLTSACGIRLFHDLPAPSGEHVIQLSLVDADDDFGQAQRQEPARPPEQTSLEQPPPEAADKPAPREVAAEDVPQPPRVPETASPLESPPPPPELAGPTAAPDLLPSPLAEASPSFELTRSPLPADLVQPPITEPRRLSLAELQPTPTFRISDRQSQDAAAPNGDLQRLIDLALPLPSAAARADVRDRTASAVNRPDEAAEREGAVQPAGDESWRKASAAAATAWRHASSQAAGAGPDLPASYRSRSAAQRSAMLEAGGGNSFTEAAVQAALQWLAANQSTDGRWDCSRHGGGRETRTLGHDRGGAGGEADMAVTGLAILAYLGAGQTHLDGPQAATVRRGLEFLTRSQATDGNLAGNAELFARMYCHGMATLALSEAYGMTGDSGLRPYLERALGYTVRAQQPQTGGWRYQPGDEGDTSQLGWQLMALRSAELAGLPIPAATRAGMIRFLNSVTTGPQRGLASYRPRAGASRTMTAEALACRLFIGLKQDKAATGEAIAYLLQETPQGGPFNEYYWYYATLALFQLQGDAWEAWNGALQERLLASQETSGTLAGSWPSDTVWGGYGGRVYTTAMNALCLEVYYRHLPLYGHEFHPASSASN